MGGLYSALGINPDRNYGGPAPMPQPGTMTPQQQVDQSRQGGGILKMRQPQPTPGFNVDPGMGAPGIGANNIGINAGNYVANSLFGSAPSPGNDPTKPGNFEPEYGDSNLYFDENGNLQGHSTFARDQEALRASQQNPNQGDQQNQQYFQQSQQGGGILKMRQPANNPNDFSWLGRLFGGAMPMDPNINAGPANNPNDFSQLGRLFGGVNKPNPTPFNLNPTPGTTFTL